jgi:predicted NUDIX family NTP pyrophosphohydrolase
MLYRIREGILEVLLVHPGGPFWQRRDAGAWSIPKGEPLAGEAGEEAARREFKEELGFAPSVTDLVSLGVVRQAGRKVVHAWATPGDFDVKGLNSNTFELEWPPRTGRIQRFPEVDRAAWFGMREAGRRLNPAQRAFLDRLSELVPPQPAGARVRLAWSAEPRAGSSPAMPDVMRF